MWRSTENVSVSVVKDTDAYKAPTCEEAGKDVYVATVTSTDDNTVLAKETKEVAIAKLGHKYGDPVWSDWEEKDGKWTQQQHLHVQMMQHMFRHQKLRLIVKQSKKQLIQRRKSCLYSIRNITRWKESC